LDLLDHGMAVEIFQLHLELGAAVAEIRGGVAADIAFVLQDVEHVRAQLGARRRHLVLAAHLRVADTGEQIAQRIVDRHFAAPLTSWTSRGRARGRGNQARAEQCATSSTCDKRRAGVPIFRNGCARGLARSCAAARRASTAPRTVLPRSGFRRRRPPSTAPAARRMPWRASPSACYSLSRSSWPFGLAFSVTAFEAQ